MEQNNCSKLHVCRHFLKGTCKFPQCIMSHNLLDDHSMRVLEMGGIDGKTASNFQAIYDFKHVEFNKEQKKGYGKLQETVVLDFEFDRGRNCSCLTSQLNPTILLGLSVHNYRPRNEYWKRPVTPTIKEVKTTLETVQCTMDVPPSEGKYLANSTNCCLVESAFIFLLLQYIYIFSLSAITCLQEWSKSWCNHVGGRTALLLPKVLHSKQQLSG